MIRIDSPFDIIRAYQALFASASEVVTIRAGQMFAGTMSGTEMTEMVAEKAVAFADATQRSAVAAISGDPRRVAVAMLAPYQEQVELNVDRLRSRGL